MSHTDILQSQNPLSSAGITNLTGEQIRSFCVEKGSMIFHLVKGRAWITVDNNDLIAEQGEIIHIPASKHNIIISPANRTGSIQFQVS